VTLVCVLTTVVGCKSVDAGQAAAAAVVVGAAVAAAAINRAATDECWGNCPPGTFCDAGSGLCVAPVETASYAEPEPTADWIECDRNRYLCAKGMWLRCEQPCEWVMCEPHGASGTGTPRRCCEQRCAWMLCPDDGHPCSMLEREPPLRTAVAAPDADPCHGLCLRDERCVVREGVADCLTGAAAR
jgi:hypothetical protein